MTQRSRFTYIELDVIAEGLALLEATPDDIEPETKQEIAAYNRRHKAIDTALAKVWKLMAKEAP